MIGVGVNTLGGFSTAVGWCLQKEGHNKSEIGSSTVYKSLHWWIGLVMVIISQPLYIVSQTLANQSTLGIVGPTSIIVHVLFARFYLHEILSWCEIAGILLFVPGTIITLIFASKHNDLLDKDEFKEKFWAPMSQIYLWGNVVGCFILYFLSYKIIKATTPIKKDEAQDQDTDSTTNKENIMEDFEAYSNFTPKQTESLIRRRQMKSRASQESELVAENSDDELMSDDSDDSRSFIGLKTNTNMREPCTIIQEDNKSWFSDPRLKFIPLIAYPYIGAFMGSISTCMVRVITGFVQKGHHKGFDVIYVLPCFMIIFCALMSYIIVNKGLKAFDSVYVAPLFKIGAMIASLTTGGVILDEFSAYKNEPTRFKFFIGGCVICLIGIILLVMGNDFSENTEKDEKKGNKD
ncbi:unnamed protein product [Moneuplotes crassus]|uniref:Magnesium transporter n=1 Tax=Euplotes crassus TaxID=5936 RepID=A0AAD1UN63_EUPCR|nr:unnamed protein product [Moneuplotes crassus]